MHKSCGLLVGMSCIVRGKVALFYTGVVLQSSACGLFVRFYQNCAQVLHIVIRRFFSKKHSVGLHVIPGFNTTNYNKN